MLSNFRVVQVQFWLTLALRIEGIRSFADRSPGTVH